MEMKLVIWIALILSLSAGAHAKEPGAVIYGPDDRQEAFEASNPFLRGLAESSVALVKNTAISTEGDSARLFAERYDSIRAQPLCSDERFFGQPVVAYCSGVLVAPDMILTAGHCIKSAEACAETKFVFGFAKESAVHDPTRVRRDDVYGCKEIVARHQADGFNPDEVGVDFALIRLDRKAAGRRPATFSRTGGPQVGDALAVYGYPWGLPFKVATNGKVRRVDRNSFHTNLDTYQGNSGSPVVNSATGRLEGILTSGEQDFQMSPEGCIRSNKCDNEGCDGERVMKLDEIISRMEMLTKK